MTHHRECYPYNTRIARYRAGFERLGHTHRQERAAHAAGVGEHALLGGPVARQIGSSIRVASRPLADGTRALYRAREEERDQSYFLFATTAAQLDLLRFPLGDRTKAYRFYEQVTAYEQHPLAPEAKSALYRLGGN